MNKMRTRTVTISLKQDITKLIESYGKWAWILHDKDVHPETAELIDPHYHIYLEFPNQRYISSIAGELGIEPNMIEMVRDRKGMLAYLTHSNHPDKYQYDADEIHSNFEIKRVEDKLTIIVVHKLLTECNSFNEFMSELVHRGLSGSLLANYGSARSIWNLEHGKSQEGET